MIILYLDSSPESEMLRRALARTGKPYQVVYEVGDKNNIPAIESDIGIIRGFGNIRCYFDLEPVEETNE